jgi:hypothetical protein
VKGTAETIGSLEGFPSVLADRGGIGRDKETLNVLADREQKIGALLIAVPLNYDRERWSRLREPSRRLGLRRPGRAGTRGLTRSSFAPFRVDGAIMRTPSAFVKLNLLIRQDLHTYIMRAMFRR